MYESQREMGESTTMVEFRFDFYFRIIRKWLWLVLIMVGVTAVAAYTVLGQRQETYRAGILISTGSILNVPDPQFDDFRFATALVETYAQIVRRSEVVGGAIEALGLQGEIGIDGLKRRIETKIIPNTALIEVTVSYRNPETAALLANELGTQLQNNLPSPITPGLREQLDLSQNQITYLDTQLQDLLAQLSNINIELTEAEESGDQETVDRLVAQRSETIRQINQSIATIAQFSDTITQIEERANVVNIVEPATIPRNPEGQNTLLFTLLAAGGIGVFLTGTVILYEASDTSWRDDETVERRLQLPVKGNLPRMRRNKTVLDLSPDSRIFERYRLLRNNLVYASEEQAETRVNLITSPTHRENKERMLVNLAQTAADSGLNVLLIDADLRQSSLHDLLDVENETGLATLLNQEKSLIEDTQERDYLLQQALHTTSQPNLNFMPSGQTTRNSIQLLESPIMVAWLDYFAEAYDFVLINTPPALNYSDVSALAAMTKLPVLLVVQYARTRAEVAYEARDQITQVGGEIAGVIFTETR